MSLPVRTDGPDTSYGVAMNSGVLREQMQLRGLTGAALAGLTGLSPATISNAQAGRRVHPRTFRVIAAALARVEPVPGAEALARSDAPAHAMANP